MNSELSTPFDDVDFERRFGGIARLYGAHALERFRNAHVCVVGVGGVGSWIVEARARRAHGPRTRIDHANVAASTKNPPIQALSSTVGMAKISALAQRIAEINPFCKVHQIEDFVEPDNLPQMIGSGKYDYLIDATDSVQAKAAMLAWARQHDLPVITIGSAGGKTDAAQISVRDLARTEQEPLLKKVRKIMRSQYGFPRGEKTKFHIDAVFSMEPLTFPDTGEVCAVDGDERSGGVTGLNCAGFGSAMVVTATFGMVAAGHALRKLADAAAAPSVAESAAARNGAQAD
jgi:tRNA A37 threonylcarbamoyladenosine dehydratase